MRGTLATFIFALVAVALLSPRGTGRFPAQERAASDGAYRSAAMAANGVPTLRSAAMEEAWQRARLEQELVLAEATGRMLVEFEAAREEMVAPRFFDDDPVSEEEER